MISVYSNDSTSPQTSHFNQGLWEFTLLLLDLVDLRFWIGNLEPFAIKGVDEPVPKF